MSIRKELEEIKGKIDVNTDAFWDHICKHTKIESWCEDERLNEKFEPGEEGTLEVYYDAEMNILFYRKEV